jgi:hypothetical protein
LRFAVGDQPLQRLLLDGSDKGPGFSRSPVEDVCQVNAIGICYRQPGPIAEAVKHLIGQGSANIFGGFAILKLVTATDLDLRSIDQQAAKLRP